MKGCSASSAIQAANSSSKIQIDLLQNEKAVKADIVRVTDKCTVVLRQLHT